MGGGGGEGYNGTLGPDDLSSSQEMQEKYKPRSKKARNVKKHTFHNIIVMIQFVINPSSYFPHQV